MTSPDDPPAPESIASLGFRPRRTRRARTKRGAPRWLSRTPAPAAFTAPEVTPAPPPARSFEAADERFFLAEDSLAPTELAVASLPADDDAPEPRPSRIDSSRRRAFARYVGAVVILAAGTCVAAFTGHASKSVATAASPVTPRAVLTAPPAPVRAPPPVAFTAERTPEPVPAVDPVAARDARELARRALERGDAASAVSAGIRSVELDPSDAEAWLVLGAAEMASGQRPHARSTFTACTRLATRGPRHECMQMLQ